jgi:hypothetical protein
MALGEALVDLDPLLTDGDLVKNRTEFAQFVDREGGGWFGDLSSMEPGHGYMLYLDKVRGNTGSTEPGFNYPSTDGGTGSPGLLVTAGDGADRSVADAPGQTGWSVNEKRYQYSMAITAVVETEGSEWRDEGDLIGAFVDGVCRGVTSPIYISGIDRYVAFLLIHSNQATGEAVSFKAFASESKTIYTVAEAITFQADGAEGTVREPLVLNTASVEVEFGDDLPAAYSLSQNHPNPFSGATTIGFQLPEPTHVVLEIYDALGREVRAAIDQPYKAGNHYFVWDGRDDRGRIVASGVYFFRFRAGAFEDMKKMVLLD